VYRNFDLKTLEQQYSPSSCIDDINIYIQEYIDLSKKALHNGQATQSVKTNLGYGKSKAEVLDLYFPVKNSTVQKKLHVYIHGGYWQELSKNESSFAATNFQQQGIHFAVINYALAPKVSLSEIVEQCRQSIAWLYLNAEQFGYSANEIHLSGSSAGGHLVMMMALTDWSTYIKDKKQIIKSICAVSGIFDLTPIAQTYVNEPLQLTEQEIANNSPLLMQSSLTQLHDCSILLSYGEIETAEFKRQTMNMYEKLIEQGIRAQIKEIRNRNHFDVIVDLAEPKSWLSQHVIQLMQGN